mgnify:CR=1 FL=1
MSEVDESVETTDVEETAAEPAVESAEPVEAVEAAFDWNGEVESMQSADWFNNLDENVRTGLLSGIQQKYQNWEKGYSSKYQELASARKSYDSRESQLRDQEARVQKWLYGEGDPLGETRAEMERMKTQHEAALSALRSEYDKAVQDIRTAQSGELKSAIEARDEAVQKIQAFEQERAAAEEAQVESQVDELESWLDTNAPDVVANDDAFYTWCVLCTGGASPEDAVQMVRAKYGAPPAAEPEPEPEPEEPSKAVELMNMGGARTGTESGQPKTFEEIMDEMRRAAQQGAFRR